MSADDGIHIKETDEGFEVRHWMGEGPGSLMGTEQSLDAAIKRGQEAGQTEYGFTFSFRDDADLKKDRLWRQFHHARIQLGLVSKNFARAVSERHPTCRSLFSPNEESHLNAMRHWRAQLEKHAEEIRELESE